MMRWVRIEDVGDTEFLIDEQTDKFRFGSGGEHEENERVILHLSVTLTRRSANAISTR